MFRRVAALWLVFTVIFVAGPRLGRALGEGWLAGLAFLVRTVGDGWALVIAESVCALVLVTAVSVLLWATDR